MFKISSSAVITACRAAGIAVAQIPLIILALALVPVITIGVPLFPDRYERIVDTLVNRLANWSHAIAEEGVCARGINRSRRPEAIRSDPAAGKRSAKSGKRRSN